MRSILGLAVSLLSVAPLVATVIVQKNGDVISGQILEEKPDKYIFQSPYGKLQIAKTNITKLILDEKTIELKNVSVGDKTVKARLVNQENNTSVYLTEDGKTIRKADKEEPPPAPEKNPETRDSILIGIAGYYGLASYQQISTDTPAAGAPQPGLDQKFRANALGFKLSGHYGLFRFLGVGVAGSFNRWSDTVAVPAQPPQVSYEAATSYTSFFIAPSAVVSVLGVLGSHATVHDVRLEVSPGMAFNAAEIQLTFKNAPAGFPQTAGATGNNRSFALQLSAYYLYSISESFRIRLGIGYYRTFYNSIYTGGLQSAPTVPGQFKIDFDNNLLKSGAPPQVIALVLGVEIGF